MPWASGVPGPSVRRVKHLTYANKSMLVGDETADLIVEYAALLAHTRDGDTVTLHVINSDGNEAEATFLLDTGAPLMAETVNTSVPEPDNSDAEDYMREQLLWRADSSPAAAADQPAATADENLDYDTAHAGDLE